MDGARPSVLPRVLSPMAWSRNQQQRPRMGFIPESFGAPSQKSRELWANRSGNTASSELSHFCATQLAQTREYILKFP